MNESTLSLPLLLDGEDKSSAFKNRIRKNAQHLRKWAKRTNTDCFRLYDRDIKEYPLAIDFYAGRYCVHYFSFDPDCDEPREDHQAAVYDALYTLFGATKEVIFERTRIKRKRTEQYEKAAEEKDFFTVYEYGTKFKINLLDYLDTGLFLDHRETRQMVASACCGKRLLNLFAYTCSFSVQAAMKGASFTKSVDLSNTYTTWGRENFLLNNLSLQNNEILRADCLRFLEEEVDSGITYDVIVIDPPTISRSKKMDQLFDVQEDYPFLIANALELLSPDGTLFFSTNSRQFDFDPSLFSPYLIREISDKTVPQDYHNKKIHRCWRINQKG